MLKDANVFPTEAPSTITPPIGSLISKSKMKRQISPLTPVVNASWVKPRHANVRLPCSIADIFTPYSVTSIGDTASHNYAAMNRNFQSIGVTEQKLVHQQKILSTNFRRLTTEQKEVSRKELYLELRAFRTQYFSNFMFELGQILKHNQLDPTYDIVFNLLREHQFCYSISLCHLTL